MTDDEKVADFMRVQLARYSAYHAHKESMAYVGLALLAGVAGTILIAEEGKWPPVTWGGHTVEIAAIALTLAWSVMLVYLRFQLHRRRWAALRMAACERVLAMWATGQLVDPNDLIAADRQSSADVEWSIRLVDFLVWPLRRAVKAVEPAKNAPGNPRSIYPRVFVSELERVEGSSTDAIYHERLMHITGWGLYFATLVRTLFSSG